MTRSPDELGPRLLAGTALAMLYVFVVCMATYIGVNVGARIFDSFPVKEPDASDADPTGLMWIFGGGLLGFVVGLVGCLSAEGFRRSRRA